MSKKYDGWVIKIEGDRPFYLMWTFRTTRKGTIKELEENWHTDYSKWRRRNNLKAVKIKVTEVE